MGQCREGGVGYDRDHTGRRISHVNADIGQKTTAYPAEIAAGEHSERAGPIGQTFLIANSFRSA